MPRKARGKAGIDNAQGAQGVETVQNTEVAPIKAHRPRVRTVTQQIEQNQRTVPNSSSPLLSPVAQPLRRSGRERREPERFSTLIFHKAAKTQNKVLLRKEASKTVARRKLTSNKPTAAPKDRAPRVPSKAKPCKRSNKSAQVKKPETRASQNAALSIWLEQIQPGPPEDLRRTSRAEATLVDHLAKQRKKNMDVTTNTSSTSASRNTLDEDYVSTAKVPRARKEKALTWDKLRARDIGNAPSDDSKLEALKAKFNLNTPPLLGRHTARLKDIWDKFFKQADSNPDENCLTALESATDEYHRYRHQIYLAGVTDREFEIDLARCKVSNEAVLQGAVMQTIIDRYQFDEVLDYNCLGQWYQHRDNQVPSTQDDEVSLPRPDLAMSFRLSSFTGENRSAPIPADIADCLHPDSPDRCFPFLFMEAKKAATDLDEALRQNMNAASQALLNMYTWMLRAGKDDTFAQDVRVFSIVLNANDLSVRIHRAKRRPDAPDDRLAYDVDELSPLSKYGRDQACLLIRSILDCYAVKELHGILKETFTEVSRLEDVRVKALQSKRKTQNSRRASSKRSRNDTEGSFGVSRVSIE